MILTFFGLITILNIIPGAVSDTCDYTCYLSDPLKDCYSLNWEGISCINATCANRCHSETISKPCPPPGNPSTFTTTYISSASISQIQAFKLNSE